MKARQLRDNDQIEGVVVKYAKRAAKQFYDKTPQITVFISRFE